MSLILGGIQKVELTGIIYLFISLARSTSIHLSGLNSLASEPKREGSR